MVKKDQEWFPRPPSHHHVHPAPLFSSCFTNSSSSTSCFDFSIDSSSSINRDDPRIIKSENLTKLKQQQSFDYLSFYDDYDDFAEAAAAAEAAEAPQRDVDFFLSQNVEANVEESVEVPSPVDVSSGSSAAITTFSLAPAAQSDAACDGGDFDCYREDSRAGCSKNSKCIRSSINRSARNIRDSNRSDGNIPDSNRSDCNIPYSNRPDSNRSDSNRYDSNRSDSNRPNSNRSDCNRPDFNRPDSNRPDSNRPDSNRPDSSRSDGKIQINSFPNSNNNNNHIQEVNFNLSSDCTDSDYSNKRRTNTDDDDNDDAGDELKPPVEINNDELNNLDVRIHLFDFDVDDVDDDDENLKKENLNCNYQNYQCDENYDYHQCDREKKQQEQQEQQQQEQQERQEQREHQEQQNHQEQQGHQEQLQGQQEQQKQDQQQDKGFNTFNELVLNNACITNKCEYTLAAADHDDHDDNNTTSTNNNQNRRKVAAHSRSLKQTTSSFKICQQQQQPQQKEQQQLQQKEQQQPQQKEQQHPQQKEQQPQQKEQQQPQQKEQQQPQQKGQQHPQQKEQQQPQQKEQQHPQQKEQQQPQQKEQQQPQEKEQQQPAKRKGRSKRTVQGLFQTPLINSNETIRKIRLGGMFGSAEQAALEWMRVKPKSEPEIPGYIRKLRERIKLIQRRIVFLENEKRSLIAALWGKLEEEDFTDSSLLLNPMSEQEGKSTPPPVSILKHSNCQIRMHQNLNCFKYRRKEKEEREEEKEKEQRETREESNLENLINKQKSSETYKAVEENLIKNSIRSTMNYRRNFYNISNSNSSSRSRSRRRSSSRKSFINETTGDDNKHISNYDNYENYDEKNKVTETDILNLSRKNSTSLFDLSSSSSSHIQTNSSLITIGSPYINAGSPYINAGSPTAATGFTAAGTATDVLKRGNDENQRDKKQLTVTVLTEGAAGAAVVKQEKLLADFLLLAHEKREREKLEEQGKNQHQQQQEQQEHQEKQKQKQQKQKQQAGRLESYSNSNSNSNSSSSNSNSRGRNLDSENCDSIVSTETPINLIDDSIDEKMLMRFESPRNKRKIKIDSNQKRPNKKTAPAPAAAPAAAVNRSEGKQKDETCSEQQKQKFTLDYWKALSDEGLRRWLKFFGLKSSKQNRGKMIEELHKISEYLHDNRS